MAVDVREQERDLVHETELPRRVVEQAAEPLARLADGEREIGSRSQDRFGVRQRFAQLDGAVTIPSAKVINDEMARDAAQPGIDVNDAGSAVFGPGKEQRLLRDVRGVGGVRDESLDERVEARNQLCRELARGLAPRSRANRSVRTARRRSRGRVTRERQHAGNDGADPSWQAALPRRRDVRYVEVGTKVGCL